MLSATYFKTNFVFYQNAIGVASGCGTGCFTTQCVVLNDSKVTRACEELQLYNFEKDKMETSYTIDWQEVSKKDGEQMFKSLGEPIEIKPKFRKLF